MSTRLLPDGRWWWEPYAAIFAAIGAVVFMALMMVALLFSGCTLMGSNGFLPY